MGLQRCAVAPDTRNSIRKRHLGVWRFPLSCLVFPFPFPYPSPLPSPWPYQSHRPRAATAAETTADLLDTSPQRDVRGLTLCPCDHPAMHRPPAQCHTGHSTGRPLNTGCSSSVGGRRRTGSVVAAFPVTTERPRCPCDAGTPEAAQKAGAEGRMHRNRNRESILRAGRPHHNGARSVEEAGREEDLENPADHQDSSQTDQHRDHRQPRPSGGRDRAGLLLGGANEVEGEVEIVRVV